MVADFAAAEEFLLRNARLVERRLFATLFRDGATGGVVAALRAYQNDDGGFGHALEADTRCPSSLPIYVETALSILATAGTTDERMVSRACDYLAAVAAQAGTGGAVAPAGPVIESYPRAAHWTDWTYVPGLNPTAGLVGRLHRLGAMHPWLEQAETYCWAQLGAGEGLSDAHTLWECLVFLAHVPDRARAEGEMARLAANFAQVPMFQLEPDAPGYGVTPLQLAPTPSSPLRPLFTDQQVQRHLDKLDAAQQTDGGWPLNWEPPAGAASQEWRGVVTLEALHTLASYGHLSRQ